MTSIASTGSNSVVGATSIAIPLGSTPTVGQLVLVFLGVSNQIVVHSPGWVNAQTGLVGTNSWPMAQGLRARTDNSGLSVFYHTWNASDSGSTATFTFSPAPSLGVGDKDLSTANAQGVALVLSASAVQEFSQQGVQDDAAATLLLPPQKQGNGGAFNVTAAYANAKALTFTTSDAAAVLRGSLSTAAGSLYVWTGAGSAGYRPTVASSAPGELLGAFLTVNDSTPNIYNPPVVFEAPVADNPLFYRYTHQRYYTVFNNSGVFTASRFPTTDQLAAATQYFTGNAPIKPADYTNLLNSGVGGDFRFSVTGT